MNLKKIYDSAIDIHAHVYSQDGHKIFPQNFSPSATKYKEMVFSTPSEPKISIVIPTYYRLETLLLTLDSLIQSETEIPFELVIYDNSFTHELFPHIQSHLQKLLKEKPNKALHRIVLYHDAYANFPQLRNIAVDQLCSPLAHIIGFWDSDMIAQPSTVNEVAITLNSQKDLYGIAPAMVSIEKSSILNKDSSILIQQEHFQMPGQIGLALGTMFSNNILLTGIMRGCFFVKRSALKKHKATFGCYFPKQFTVWSNVAFFIGMREMGMRYGYLLTTSSYVINNDQDTSFTIGKELNHRILENLKSILLLILRNALFIPKQRDINKKFEQYTCHHIADIYNISLPQAEQIYSDLLQYASMITSKTQIHGLSKEIMELHQWIMMTISSPIELTEYTSKNSSIPIYDTHY